MAAGALAATHVPSTKPFSLNVGGRNVTALSPVGDQFATHISEVSDGSPSQMTFWIEESAAGQFMPGDPRMGDEVRLVDQRGSDPDTLFGGHLVNVQMTRRPAGTGRLLECTALGYDAYLDWRIVGRNAGWSSKTGKVGGQVTSIASDRHIVQILVNQFGAGIQAPAETVQQTNTNMPPVSFKGATLREALSRVGDAATGTAPDSTRSFYVDRNRILHYYWNQEALLAPYLVSDGTYTRTVLTESGIVSLWTMREPTGSTVSDGKGYSPGWLTGGYTRGTPTLTDNEPALTATLLDGSSGYVTVTGANIHPGDTFTVEFLVKRVGTGTAQTIWSGGTGDVEIGFDASDSLVVIKEGTGNNFVTDRSFTSTVNRNHIVVARSPGSTIVYVNGVSVSGTTTARTFAAAAGTVNIGRRKSSTDRYFRGHLAMVGIYSTKMNAATALAHYNQSASIAVENLTYELDATDGREQVYVFGQNKAGSGWVKSGLLTTAFGDDERARQDVIERPNTNTAGGRDNQANAFLKVNRDPKVSASFEVTGYGGWHVGQDVYITDAAFNLTSVPLSLMQVDLDVNVGAGVIRYTCQLGQPLRSGTRRLRRGAPRR